MIDILQRKRGSSGPLVLLVVFVFMLCALFLILYGAKVYKGITARADADFARRMGVSYITNKIRAHDLAGGVELLPGGAGVVLCADPRADEPLYTFIYCHGGYIMEYLTDLPDEFEPENGEPVTEAEALSVRRVDGGLRVSVASAAGESVYTVALRCF